MRSTFIIATCALAVFAAPVPEPNPIYKSGGTGCARVLAGVCVKTGKREVEAPVRSNTKHAPSPFGRSSHPRDVEDDDEITFETRSPAPEPFGRSSHPRDVEDDDEVTFETRSPEPEPFGRSSHPRGVEDDDEITLQVRDAVRNQGRSPVRLGRPKNSRSVAQEEEDVEARAIRNQGRSQEVEDVEARAIRNQGRSQEVEDVEARAIRNQGKRSVREKKVSEEDVESRAIRNQGRNAEPEPFGRAGAGKRTPEAEPGFTRAKPGYRRSASAEPGTVRPSNKRTADAEPINRIHG
ncbi:hypothetical protein P171DRAFT_435669 [Karstenula rhodostoma CBS 690.94]|uniref:Uncharacterized protein n=1 Tax=Karstenula rhodostoma CBS 690.94 TaxID=1392251 RepID=A0A9P4U7G6_9PLEO|nr:hypothetical protein P171DRAFT_435669 [Karstenula rhodostoma CBS 690.94]